MRITQLQLQNFRFFADQSFAFPSLFTVLIGENGRGKSAVLHGLRVAASGWLLGFKETERLHIEPEDVRRVELETRFAPQFPAVVRASGVVENKQLEWRRERTDLKSGLDRMDRVKSKSLLELSRRSEQRTNNDLFEIDLPVLVFFSTARLRVGAKKGMDLKPKGSKIEDGYFHALTPDYKRKGPSARTVALGWIKKAYFKVLEEGGGLYFSPQFLSWDESNTLSTASGTTKLLQAVFQAIMTCVPDWTMLRWDTNSDDLSGLYQRPESHVAERVPLYYLSDGVRTMVGMVAEIAYRCVTLNGHLEAEAVRGSRGLVLIDELDMHLHPNWQRHVVADLKKAFPNLQFVVTTHSPFIVQSLDAAELINLDFEDPVVPSSPKDMPIDEVAVEVMGVDSELGKEGEENQEVADEHLSVLRTAKKVANGQIDSVTSQKLEELEESVSDIGLRMALRMERILREYPATKLSDETD